jgi:hypothetical protein
MTDTKNGVYDAHSQGQEEGGGISELRFTLDLISVTRKAAR